MIFIVMGVAGSGKSTVGKRLAERIGLPFHDADDFHPVSNIEKMRRAEPLDDNDRASWLMDLAFHVAQWNRRGGAVLACSALKTKYREVLSWSGNEATQFIYLRGDRDEIAGRLRDRAGHFFRPELLESQFRDLEEPSDAIVVPVALGPDEACDAIISRLEDRGLLPGPRTVSEP